MLYWMCKKSRGLQLTWPQMKHAIMRNFGGLKSDKVDPFEEFCLQLKMTEDEPKPDDYEDVDEVAVYIHQSFCLYDYTLCLDRYGQSLIRIAQGLV